MSLLGVWKMPDFSSFFSSVFLAHFMIHSSDDQWGIPLSFIRFICSDRVDSPILNVSHTCCCFRENIVSTHTIIFNFLLDIIIM